MIDEDERLKLEDHGIAAERLRTDPAFQRALTAIRDEKVKALIGLDSNDIPANIKARAEIEAIDQLCGQIATAIQRGQAIGRAPKAVA